MVDAAVNVRLISDYSGVTVTLKSSTNKNHYNTIQYNVLVRSLQKLDRLCITMSVNI